MTPLAPMPATLTMWARDPPASQLEMREGSPVDSAHHEPHENWRRCP